MRLSAIKQTLSDIVELTTDDGSVFFIRLAFLATVDGTQLAAGAEFSEEQSEEILDAGLAFAAERKAEDYLARSEQCRAGLEKKLLQKGHSKQAVKTALDFLEEKKLLDDLRFCSCWLRSHTMTKPQGRQRLLSELCSRGIKQTDAKTAVDEFFTENDEVQLCKKALAKAVKNGKKDEKLIKYMMDSGFSYKMIKSVLEET